MLPPLLKVPPASRGEPCGGLVPALREGNQKGSVPPAGRGNLQEGVRKILLGAPRVCAYALAGLQTAPRVCAYALAGLQTAPRVCAYALAGLQTAPRVCAYALAGLQYTDAVFVPLACTVCLLTGAGTRIG
jgi:hypothetical protein